MTVRQLLCSKQGANGLQNVNIMQHSQSHHYHLDQAKELLSSKHWVWVSIKS